MKVCSAAAAAVGLPAWAGEKMAEKVAKGQKPSVVWLHFQECTGCTESLLRTSHPDVGALVLDLISLDYHETLAAAAGHQFEASLEAAKKQGGYVLVVEGAIPKKQDGIFCVVGGKTAVQSLVECAERAAAVICIGSCASWGGVPSADPEPDRRDRRAADPEGEGDLEAASSRSPAARRTRTTCSARCSSSRRSGRSRSSTRRRGRSSRTAA